MNAAAGCTRAASRLACVSLDEGVGGAAAVGAVLAATSTVLAADTSHPEGCQYSFLEYRVQFVRSSDVEASGAAAMLCKGVP